MLRLLTALLAGVTAAGLTLYISTDSDVGTWHFYTLPVTILLFVLTSIGKSMRGVSSPPAAELQASLDNGLGSLARVERIGRTGTLINDNPVCELTLVVAPHDEDAYVTTVRTLIDLVTVPQYQPGAVVVVARVAKDRPEVHLVREPDAEWRRRVQLEGERIPPRERAREWAGDANTAPGPKPIISIGKQGRGARAVAYVVLLVLGFAVPVALNWDAMNADDPADPMGPGTATGAAPPELPTDEASTEDVDFVNSDRQDEAVDALVELTGGTDFNEIVFQDSGLVSAEAPSEPGALTLDSYLYVDGVATREGPAIIQPEDPEAEMFDIDDIDLSRLSDDVTKAYELTGMDEDAVGSSMIIIQRDISAVAMGEPAVVEISVSLSGEYYNGWVDFDGDGAVIGMSGGEPGSEADSQD